MSRQSLTRFQCAVYDGIALAIFATLYAICVGLVR